MLLWCAFIDVLVNSRRFIGFSIWFQYLDIGILSMYKILFLWYVFLGVLVNSKRIKGFSIGFMYEDYCTVLVLG